MPAVLVGIAVFSSVIVAAPTAAADETPPALSPEPQSVEMLGEGFRLTPTTRVIVGDDADDVALREVRELLADHGVDKVEVVAAPADPSKSFTVYLGEAPADLVAALGAEPANGLPTEGYALTIGRDAADRKLIVLDGVDTDGTYYATQTLRQLVVDEEHGKASVPSTVIRDWPATEYRGSIEGFYGTPWSHEQRLDHLRYLGAHKMNTYVYTPKDDPYLRARWREPYPEQDRERIRELVEEAAAHKVDFTYAVSPGLSVCYSSAADRQALVDKFQSVYELGVRSFVVPLDDIAYTSWNCDADAAAYGSGQAAAGQAQADLLNHVQREWVETLPEIKPLQFVPTQYHDVADSPYKQVLRAELDSAVIAQWTGVAVVPAAITTEQAVAATEVWERDIVIWDNFPVNDYAPGRLLLGDYRGREAGVTDVVAGILSNPMNQAAVSKIALYSFAEYSWNPTNYEAGESHHRALEEVAGGAADVVAALEVFADLSWYDGPIHRERAPQLAADVAAFWEAWDTGDRTGAVAGLRPRADAIAAAPATIRSGVSDQLFVAEAEAWLSATELWGRALQASLTLLEALEDDDGAAAWDARQRITGLVAAALAIRDTTVVHNQTNPKIADGVLDTFIAEVTGIHDQWLGLRRGVSASSSLPTYQGYAPDLMLDGDAGTWFWSAAAVGAGDYVQVDLGGVVEIGEVSLLMARSASPGDYFHHGVLEYSSDGIAWQELTTASAAEVSATAPTGTLARYVRYRATANNVPANWAIVREFQVATVTGGTPAVANVTAQPGPTVGSEAGFAADGDLATAYAAAATPASGDAIEVAYTGAADLAGVTVLQNEFQDGTGLLQARSAGDWVDVGKLSGNFTRIPTELPEVDAVRILWMDGSDIPAVAEVIPTWADDVVHAISAEDVDLVRGQAGPVDVVVSAAVGEALTGGVRLDVPDGWDVTPATVALTVPGGLSQTARFIVTPPAAAELAPVVLQSQLVADDGTVLESTDVEIHVRPVVGEENVALGQPVSASGVEPGTQNAAALAVDGDPNTRWASNYDDAAWWQVDLGAETTIGRVDISWEAAHAASYEIQVSADGTTWTTAALVTGSEGGQETVWVDASGRWVRLQGVERATTWGYSMFEFEVRAQV